MPPQIVQPLLFDFLSDLSVVVQPQEGQITSDAGLLPIAQFDRRWRYTQRMAQCLEDAREVPQHQFIEMLRQRLFGILAGYEDCNDHDTLRADAIFKMVAGRRPDDEPLASQPTLSRFENSITPACLQKLIDFLIATGISRLKHRHDGQLPASLTLDLDATDDPAHGQQQLVLFHGYYDQYQYFPLILSEPTTKHVFLAQLRHGTAHAAHGADESLLRVATALRQQRPDIAIHIRGDAGFGLPAMYDVCENNHLSYTFGLATNARLKKITEALMNRAVELYQQTGQKQRLFMALEYQAESWEHPRTVVAKAECHAGGTNLRFVVTNLPGIVTPEQAQRVYDDYVQRGESEQRMDELKNGLCADRLSCHRFMANFWRLLLHTAAFNLLAGLRSSEELPQVLRVGQPCTWRTHVIKVGAIVIQSVRRIVVRLSGSWPWWPLYRAAGVRALAFSAGP